MGKSARQIIETVCSELAASPLLDEFLHMAIELTDRTFFGTLFNHAIAYRACHLFTITEGAVGGNPAIGTGQITGVSEGGLSMNFASNAKTDNGGLETTKYGKLLLGLINSRPRMGVNRTGLR